MQYLLFWRMSLARKALLSSTDKIEQIAFRIGYQSASAFNVAFTKYVGMPPGYSDARNPMLSLWSRITDEKPVLNTLSVNYHWPCLYALSP
jgi:AraC-like DNA-binding protein